MWQALLSILCILAYFFTVLEIIFFSIIYTWGHRGKFKSSDSYRTACKWRRWHLSPGSLAPAPLLLIIILFSNFWIVEDIWWFLTVGKIHSKASNFTEIKVFKQIINGWIFAHYSLGEKINNNYY